MGQPGLTVNPWACLCIFSWEASEFYQLQAGARSPPEAASTVDVFTPKTPATVPGACVWTGPPSWEEQNFTTHVALEEILAGTEDLLLISFVLLSSGFTWALSSSRWDLVDFSSSSDSHQAPERFWSEARWPPGGVVGRPDGHCVIRHWGLERDLSREQSEPNRDLDSPRSTAHHTSYCSPIQSERPRTTSMRQEALI